MTCSGRAFNISYQNISLLSPSQFLLLEKLMKACDDYEPYYACELDDSIHMTAAFLDETMIGFAGLLINSDDNTCELTALVHPMYRKQGIFSELVKLEQEFAQRLSSTNSCNCTESTAYTIIGSIPATLVQSHFPYAQHIAFTEYMMKLTESSYEAFMSTDTANHQFPPSSSNEIDDTHMMNPITDFSDCEFCFSEDGCTYMMYANEDAEEPCAVINLAAESSFVNVYGVWVDVSLRGQGYGSALMDAFLEDYFCDDEYDLKPLVLNVRSTNTAAFKLYKKCGFTEASHISYWNLT